MTTLDLDTLRQALRDFVRARDWEPFQSPKNLSMALIVEAAELVEHFQWLTQQESRALPPERRRAVAHEMADILIYLLRLADVLDIDLLAVAEEKLRINMDKYPVERVRGSAKKYDEY